MKKRRTKRNPIPAALAVLKAAGFSGMRRNPKKKRKMKTPIMYRNRPRGFQKKHERAQRRAAKAGILGFKNPASKHIHLQEKRGMGWVTIAMFPMTQKAAAIKIAKQWHRKHPGKTLRLFS